MKIAVISDTHGKTHNYHLLIKYTDGCDMIAHLGDYVSDAADIAERTGKEVVSVKGNGDYYTNVPLERIININGEKLLLLHGHSAGVKRGLAQLAARAKECGVQTALYGHTHIPAIDRVGGILLINPGSLGEPRMLRRASLAVIEIRDGSIKPMIIEL